MVNYLYEYKYLLFNKITVFSYGENFRIVDL